MMATRWQIAGGEAVTKLFAGAPHGFVVFPPEEVVSAREALAMIREFLNAKMGG